MSPPNFANALPELQALLDELGPDTVQLMRLIKNAWDPRGILNPEKIF